MRYVDEVMRTIYEKGWFIHKMKWHGHWIPVLLEYKDSVTEFYSGSLTCWEDPVESFQAHKEIHLPTKWLPGLERNKIRIHEWTGKKVS